MKNIFLVVLALLALYATVGYYRDMQQPRPGASEAAQAPFATASPPAAPVSVPQPVANHFPLLEDKSPAVVLPALDDSDPVLWRALGQLAGSTALSLYFNEAHMIRNFVVTVDNLPRELASANALPVKSAPGTFLVIAQGQELRVNAANAKRYMPFIDMIAAVNPQWLFALYRQNYPLFQQAYTELGFPTGYFNDRLVAAMDDLLAAPEMTPATALVQPKVLYEFADPELQGRSAGQKILVRTGADNERRLKKLIRVYRAMAVADSASLRAAGTLPQ